jgi:hypothetical protein
MEAPMTQTLQTSQTFRIHVIAASPAAPLAILSIASILGIEPQQAADRLASLPTVLADAVAGPEARRLSAVLMAFGFRVRLDPTSSSRPDVAAAEATRDVALQAIGCAGSEAPAARLSMLVDLPPEVVHAGLAQPHGLVIEGVPVTQAEALCRVFRRDRTIRVLLSDPAVAIFDGFAVPESVVSTDELRRLGLARCRFSGAVASGMNSATARHLERRAKGSILVLNRDFQRFDLVLTSVPNVPDSDVAGFLASRFGFGVGDAAVAQRVETDLPRRMAEQFATDYAAIGIEVRACLRGVSENI